ncbi:MAG: hypothetical protein AWU57_613 [Marinobacter sp. T13-3]|nr:MAG: hypothetical protein AWU57_613 [Marinobacter sp. T13-3]
MTDPDVTPFAVYSPDGPTLTRIVITDEEIQSWHQAGAEIIDTHSPVDLLLEMAPEPASAYMDNATWTALAPAFKQAAVDVTEQYLQIAERPIYKMPPVAPDFPAPLIKDRMDALTNVFDANIDLESWVDLQEVAFARQTGRHVNVEVLSNDARGSSWDTVYEEELDDLNDQLDSLHKAGQQRDPADPDSQRLQVINDLEARELEYAIETGFEDELSLAPS